MTEHEIITMVNEVFLKNTSKSRGKDSCRRWNIFEDLELDSLDIVDLVVTLQKKFDVSIRDDERIRSVRTLGELHQFILTLKSEGVSQAI